jgi:hypothetical protein
MNTTFSILVATTFLVSATSGEAARSSTTSDQSDWRRESISREQLITPSDLASGPTVAGAQIGWFVVSID